MAGAIALLAVGLAARLAGRSGRDGRALSGGIALTVAALLAISRERAVPVEVLVAVAGIGAAGAGLGSRPRWLLRGALAAPFATLLAVDSSPTAWTRVAVGLAATLVALSAADLDRRLGWGMLTPVLYAMSVAGVFVAVPDTEEAAALLGAALPLAVLAWRVPWARLGSAGAASATALLIWTTAVGGRGRPPSIVGGLACLGLLAVVPLLDLLLGRGRFRSPSPTRAVLVHGVPVLVAARIAGISPHMDVAVTFALLSVAIAMGGAYALRGRPARDVRPA